MLDYTVKYFRQLKNFNKRKCQVIYLGLYWIFSNPVSAQTVNQQPSAIYWYYGDFPPYYIISGPNQGQGLADRRMQILAQRMPQFRHEYVFASLRRFLEMAKTEPNICHAALFKTPERSQIMLFSKVVLENLSNGVITLRSRLPEFKPFLDPHGQIHLQAFLDSKQYQLGVVTGRSFGSRIDALLKKHIDKNAVVSIPSNDMLASLLLKLLKQDEYAAIIGYPYELQYVVRQLQLNSNDFVFLPIAEQLPAEPTYVGCSKSPFGQQVIRAVNRALTNPMVRREIDLAYRFWLDAESIQRWDSLAKPQHTRK